MSETTKELIDIAIKRVEENGGSMMVNTIKIYRDGNGIILEEH